MASSIYTRTGDEGQTGLADGSRRPKDDHRIDAISALDELNAALGVVAAYPESADERTLLHGIQRALFDIGAELAAPGSRRLPQDAVTGLEAAIDRIDARLPPLTAFILPGGGVAGAQCHMARTLCRRAERALFRLARHETVNSLSLVYLNRLSDLLFVLARRLVREGGGEEVLWHPQ